MNEKGITFIHSVFGLFILFTIAAFIIPLQLYLEKTLAFEVIQVHASEVAMNGMLIKKYYQLNNGTQQIENIEYSWHFDGKAICVAYMWREEQQKMCIDEQKSI